MVRGFPIPNQVAVLKDPTSALFQLALGISPPWAVDRLEFDPERRGLDIHIVFQRGAHFTCPEGDGGECPIPDTADKERCYLNFFQHEAYSSSTRPTFTPVSRGSAAASMASARSRCPGHVRAAASPCSSRRWRCC